MKIMRGTRFAALLLVAAFAWSTACAQDPAYARSLAASCFTCHGTEGVSAGGVPPSLAGQDKRYLVQQMQDFKAGTRPATIMHQLAKGYTDAQIELIAGYFGALGK